MQFDGKRTLHEIKINGASYDYYSLPAAEAAGLSGVARLPYTLKIVLENLIRQQAEGTASSEDVNAVLEWLRARTSEHEIGFKPARVLMPDSSGIPLLGDMAAMRDAMARLDGDPRRLNPLTPVDFIVDHSVMVDEYGNAGAMVRNMALELARNRERYEFLRWGSRAFEQLKVIPPGTGICHQINLEHLARVVWTREHGGRVLALPDSVIGMDSHTPMINGLGIVGWGVGGVEGGVAALGEPVAMLIPEVVGCRVTGKRRPGVTATDIVLTITHLMRRHKVIGKFIEFFGPGVDELTLPDRATIANMTPEYGATVGYFPVDAETLRFLRLTGRDAQQVALVEAYCKAQGLWRDAGTAVPDYTAVVEIDLGAVEPSVAGPRRPNERVPLPQAPQTFRGAYPGNANAVAVKGADFRLHSGDVVIAAITSCTNTSNPAVMIGAGLLARNARARGLKSKPWVKTSLSPGSRVVSDYLAGSGLNQPLEELGFHLTGYGCMTCMGNSGPLADPVALAIEEGELAAVAVLSGNRNFEGRIHPSVRANFLASPPLVVAYALAGSILKDVSSEPLGEDRAGRPVYLRDLWPEDEEVRRIVEKTLTPEVFRSRYEKTAEDGAKWAGGTTAAATLFSWNPGSTFIRRPPFFDDVEAEPAPVQDIRGARMLAMFGDMLTTDHISPIGAIPAKSPAGRYLQSLGIAPEDFVNYASRRLNHDVMTRGTFANLRIRNELTPNVEGSWTRHVPSGEEMSIFDAAERYRGEGVPLIVIAGSEYGAGSSRDWAAKGTRLLGVRAVIAESFERIHRSNLVGLGVLPLQLVDGATRKTLKLDGSEVFDITGLEAGITPRMDVSCIITRANGRRETIRLRSRLDTRAEVEYYHHGGIFHYVLRRLIKEEPSA
ncbi:MAG: aconitate hydratase 1 [Betaproteobacteria bacterium RIFCSPLOWO2_12_FULL_62_13]|nr:MAG: aconitate hydratase 1 [Betaproteobacteria bacterium RIFCSPLOWO2_12_FULL_62_13]